MEALVDKEFKISQQLKTARFVIRMLTVNDVIKDYEAVMTSVDHLRKTMPFGPDHRWPTHELTLEQDLIDLGWHQKEFQNRTSFAYTVMSPDEQRCMGCVYLYPSPNVCYDAMIIMWVRQSELAGGLDEYLYASVKDWISKKWPFENPGYPGREINWENWNKLKNEFC